MNYREAKRILEQQNNAQEVINQYKGLETFGKRIGYSSNMELIEALLEMEPALVNEVKIPCRHL